MSIDKIHLLGRRNFLSGLATIGLSTAAVSNVSKEALAEVTGDPTEEVPQLSHMEHCSEPCVGERPPEREPKFFTVPRDEFAYREARYVVAEELAEELERTHAGSFSGWVTTRVNGQKREKIVRIERETDDEDAIPLAELQGDVPDRATATVGAGDEAVEVDDVRVVVEDADAGSESDCSESPEDGEDCHGDYFTERYAPIAAGAAVNCGTLGPVVYDRDREEHRLTTAGHAYDPGEYVFQPCNDSIDNLVGRVDKHAHDDEMDVATIDLSWTDRAVHNSVVDESGSTNAITMGTVSTDRLKEMEDDRSERVYRQGAATGRVEGYITDVSPQGDVHKFETRTDGTDGDSGGPYWIDSDSDRHDYIHMLGIHEWDQNQRQSISNDRTRGTAMADYEELWNLVA